VLDVLAAPGRPDQVIVDLVGLAAGGKLAALGICW